MIAFDRLNELVIYDPETGDLKWAKHRSPKSRAGDIVGRIDIGGYRKAMIDYRHYYVHRLIWLLVYGKWPDGQIDHKNGNRADNRLFNLREATRAQQNQNKKAAKTNKSGIKGAWARYGKWRSAIQVNGVLIDLGWFNTPQEANAAYGAAAKKYFGQFARDS